MKRFVCASGAIYYRSERPDGGPTDIGSRGTMCWKNDVLQTSIYIVDSDGTVALDRTHEVGVQPVLNKRIEDGKQ